MTKSKIMTTVNNSVRKISFKINKHSPEILIAVGIAGTIVSTVMACRATTKVSEIMNETKETVDTIHKVLDKENKKKSGEVVEYTADDSKKDLTIVYAQTGVKLAKLYAPSVILGTLSITSILTSHNIIRKRNAALATAYATIDQSFKSYRKNVVDRFGEEADKEMRYGIKAKKIEEVITDAETGKEKKVKKTVGVVDPNLTSDYACYFDKNSSAWDCTPDYNLMFLRGQQSVANDLLISRGHLFLNEVYDMLDLPRTKMGQCTGWVYNPNGENAGDNFVDFHILQTYRENADGTVEPTILLDFNVDGPILDLID